MKIPSEDQPLFLTYPAKGQFAEPHTRYASGKHPQGDSKFF